MPSLGIVRLCAMERPAGEAGTAAGGTGAEGTAAEASAARGSGAGGSGAEDTATGRRTGKAIEGDGRLAFGVDKGPACIVRGGKGGAPAWAISISSSIEGASGSPSLG